MRITELSTSMKQISYVYYKRVDLMYHFLYHAASVSRSKVLTFHAYSYVYITECCSITMYIASSIASSLWSFLAYSGEFVL